MGIIISYVIALCKNGSDDTQIAYHHFLTQKYNERFPHICVYQLHHWKLRRYL